MEVKVIGASASPEFVISTAGRACYKSESTLEPAKEAEFVRKRVKQGHESIIEHASITYDISGISRACSHQLVRHRLASYSQESQRYVDMDGNAEYVIPPEISKDKDATAYFLGAMAYMENTYSLLRGLGIRKEDARYVLPNATQTRIIVTMNFRELRHFFKVRCDKAAQWEIRELALKMLMQAYAISPTVFEDLYNEYVA